VNCAATGRDIEARGNTQSNFSRFAATEETTDLHRCDRSTRIIRDDLSHL
jgi:hypothetical protein